MKDKVKAALAGLSPGSALVCAVSGGADSVALLHCLWALSEELGFSLSAAHFNHCLRGEESDGDEAFVRYLCKQWGVPLAVGRGDAAKRARETGESLEEAARALRHGFLSAQPGIIATAHNADDQVETVLINLLRGTGLKGLCGMEPRTARMIRPLLTVTRAEILAYLQKNGLSWREDSSNFEDDALRNRLRHHVIPLFRQENPSLAATVARSTAILRRDEGHLEQETAALLHKAARDGGWDVPILSRAPEALKTRALRQILGGSKPAAVHVAAMEALLQSTHGSSEIALPGNRLARREYDLLSIVPAEDPVFSPVTLRPGEGAYLPGAKLWVSLGAPEILEKDVDFLSTFALNCDMMEKNLQLTIRPRQPGDALRLPGGTRSLKRLMIDRKIPASMRERLPVAADGRGVAAVYGLGCARDRRAAPGQRAVVLRFWREGSETND